VGDALCRVAYRPVTEVSRRGAAGVTRRARVRDVHGLHARPAARLVAALADHSADVRLRTGDREANARSVTSLMALGVAQGDEVELWAEGPDAAAALEALATALGEAAPHDRRSVEPPVAGTRLAARVAVAGGAQGRAVRIRRDHAPDERASAAPAAEWTRLESALERVTATLDAQLLTVDGVARGVLAAHRAILADPELWRQARGRITEGAPAAAAARAVLADAASRLQSSGHAHLAERRADLRDVERRLLDALAGAVERRIDLPERTIVLADELLPGELLALDLDRVAAIVMAAGGATSHVALLAASFDRPMLVGAGETLLEVADGTTLLVDAHEGWVEIDPPAERLAAYDAARAEALARRQAENAVAHEPARLRDGTRIRVECNLGAVSEAQIGRRAGADGVGLLRTEFLYLDRHEPPTVVEQQRLYEAIATTFADRPVTIRTLDAGGDKPLPFLPSLEEPNPALGLRGLRAGLERPALLDAQLQAIASTGVEGQCRVLVPMVNDAADIVAVRERLRLQVPPGRSQPSLGVMIETPAAALQVDALAPHCDFFSIGSNDLTQYVLAIDRLHPTLAGRLDGLHPAVLRILAMVTEAAQRHGRDVGVCGALAADPEAVAVLIGLGVRELSVVPAAIARTKAIVRGLDLHECVRLATAVCASPDAVAVRQAVRRFMHERGVA
jgi:phosphocarrier protein FPr/phosphocarrier protein